jgi:hypothetical protein
MYPYFQSLLRLLQITTANERSTEPTPFSFDLAVSGCTRRELTPPYSSSYASRDCAGRFTANQLS